MPLVRNYSKQRNVFLIGSLYRNFAERVEWVDRFEMSFENCSNDKNESSCQGILIWLC